MKSHCFNLLSHPACHGGRRGVIALLLLTLGGCASAPDSPPPARKPSITLGSATQSADDYLALAESSEGTQQLSYLLLAARDQLQQGQLGAASNLLDAIEARLPQQGALQAEYRLLRARLALESGARDSVMSWLNWPAGWALSPAQWRDRYAISIRYSQQSGDPLGQALGHYQLGRYLTPDLLSQNDDRIWSLLSGLPDESLKAAMAATQEAEWRAWLELAWLAQHYGVQPNTMLSELARWQSAHPRHPAARRLPDDLERALNVQPYRPNTVAVLLPLSGQFANQAKAIQQGLLANLLAQPESRTMRFYDTETMPVADAYRLALDEGAEFVIGPLLRGNVDALLEVYGQEVPLLALNQAPNGNSEEHLFFFSLDPETEARQAADRMWHDGITHPLILASGNTTGQRMAEQFQAQWQAHSDDPVEIHYFRNNDQIRGTVQSALHVDESEARIASIRKLFGNTTQADFRSRRDIDGLYLVANGDEVRLLKPFVDANIAVFADPLALYGSSRAHGELANQQIAGELEGLSLSDMPWLLSDNAQRQQAVTLWPERSLALQRLYAMGYDSWGLIDRLAQMRVFTGYQMRGLSGQFTVDSKGQLLRQLSWGKYRRGALQGE
ncbi:penicillin-binding protein activator [Ferrimonas gelatinilytica]|uniref:Penicillin-binding protein activator n=1 Tax=Ferrimonas gelatinilytica TaxID=1255257 RepID=A0ABP9SCZ8_9GAMM